MVRVARPRQSHYHSGSLQPFVPRTMKRLITSILIGVVLYFLLPFITKFIPQYRLAVWCVTTAIVSFAVSAVMDKV